MRSRPLDVRLADPQHFILLAGLGCLNLGQHHPEACTDQKAPKEVMETGHVDAVHLCPLLALEAEGHHREDAGRAWLDHRVDADHGGLRVLQRPCEQPPGNEGAADDLVDQGPDHGGGDLHERLRAAQHDVPARVLTGKHGESPACLHNKDRDEHDEGAFEEHPSRERNTAVLADDRLALDDVHGIANALAQEERMAASPAAGEGVARGDERADGHPHGAPGCEDDAGDLPAGDLLLADRSRDERGADGQGRLPGAPDRRVLVLEPKEEASLRESEAEADGKNSRDVAGVRNQATIHRFGGEAEERPHHCLPHELEHQRASAADAEL
mmetsp:Transcript_85020/g.253452  ORF Transcript_85020/g.253452 Transcript_85020/m.253452 type:complete len:327 (-) Transcript_85020:45-1025(-)